MSALDIVLGFGLVLNTIKSLLVKDPVRCNYIVAIDRLLHWSINSSLKMNEYYKQISD